MAPGKSLLRLLKTFARKKEPIAEKTQPNRLILPKDAVAAGIKKTPAPIIEPSPMTTASAVPRRRAGGPVEDVLPARGQVGAHGRGDEEVRAHGAEPVALDG